MGSAKLPFTVHYRGAAKTEQGMPLKSSALRRLATSQRALVTHTCTHAHDITESQNHLVARGL